MSPFRTGHLGPLMPRTSSRLTYRRLRHPTPLPAPSASNSVLGRYLSRLTWLFG